MTDTGPSPRRRRRKPVAAASRVAIGGMSLTVGFGVLTALALSAPTTGTTASVQLDAGTPVTVPAVPVTVPVEVPAETPPTTIVIITHYVPADDGTGSSRSSGATSAQGPSRPSSSSSSGATPAPVAAPSAASAPAAASPAPVAAPKPTAPPVTSTTAS